MKTSLPFFTTHLISRTISTLRCQKWPTILEPNDLWWGTSFCHIAFTTPTLLDHMWDAANTTFGLCEDQRPCTRDSKADLCCSQNNCQIEHNLFICPFVTPFGFGSCGLGLGSSLFFLPFPLCWVLCLMELTSVSLSLPNSRDSPVTHNMAKRGLWHGLLTMVWHRLGLSSLQNPLHCHRNWITKPHLFYKLLLWSQ